MKLLEVRRPEDLFGPLSGETMEQLEQARRVYRNLARRYHPDAAGTEEEFKRLNELWTQAENLISAGLYGDRGALPKPIVFTSKRGTYTATREIDGGDVCRIFEAGDNLLKIVRS